MKLVRERLYEYMGFTEEGDPIKDMGIGIDELIHKWMGEHGIAQHLYRITGKKRIVGDSTLIFSRHPIKKFPEYIRFAHINGGFHVDNCGLETLEGGPNLIQGSFFCSNNPLKTSGLKGGPEQVIGSYAASNCGLETLEGMATNVEDAIYLNDNDLYSLEFLPKRIKAALYVSGNPIGTLDNFPTTVEGDLSLSRSKLIPNWQTIADICKVDGTIYLL
jgi:hypothetical protein